MPDLFPLPLTPFETYMVLGSWKGDPMRTDLMWFFRGTFDRESFERSLERALDLNPLYRCRVDWSVRGYPRWVLVDAAEVKVHWDATVPERWDDDFDLSEEVGTRIWIGPVGDGLSRATIRNHHAVSDGLGTARFWGDVLHGYSLLRSPPGGEMTGWADPDVELLKLRGAIAPERTLMARARGVVQMLRQGKIRPTPLAIPSDRPPEPWTDGRNAMGVIGKAGYERLRAFASSRGATLNDYLVASLFRTVVAWNERHGKPSATDLLRVMVPTSGRDMRHLLMPAANCIGFSILDRTPADCADHAQLLSSLGSETRAIRKQHVGASFIDILSATQALARARGRLFPRKRKRRASRAEATVILSYLGDGERLIPQGGPHDAEGHYICGDVTLIRPTGYVPRQDDTRIAISAHYTRGELVFGLNADPTYFDFAQASEFVELYRSTLLADASAVDQAVPSEVVASAE